MSNAHIETVRVEDGFHLVGRWLSINMGASGRRTVLVEDCHPHDGPDGDPHVVLALSSVSEGARSSSALHAQEGNMVSLADEASIARAKGRYLDLAERIEAGRAKDDRGTVGRTWLWRVHVTFLAAWVASAAWFTLAGSDMRIAWFVALPIMLLVTGRTYSSKRRNDRRDRINANQEAWALEALRGNCADITANRPLALRNESNAVHGREGEPFIR